MSYYSIRIQSIQISQLRNLRFAGDTSLAQAAAASSGKSEILFGMNGHRVLNIVVTLFFIVQSLFGQCSGRAALDTVTAGVVGKKETVGPMICIGSFGGWDIDPGDDGTGAHGFPNWCD